MTAPHATKAPVTTEPRTRRAPARRVDRDTARPRSSSAERALERRRKRLEQQQDVLESGGTLRETPAERALRRHREGADNAGLLARIPSVPRALTRRMPFALAVLALVAGGLGLTLWLSTGSAENSYDLTRREAVNNTLAEKKAALERDVKSGESAPGLAERASDLGMIPAGTLPVLVSKGNGKVVVVGKPSPATGSANPPLNPPVAVSDPSGATSSGSGTPVPGNTGSAPSGGEQLVTMNPGTPSVANTSAPAPGGQAGSAQTPTQTPTPSAPAVPAAGATPASGGAR